MAASEEKQILRNNLLDERFDLSPDDVKNHSNKILNTLSDFISWNDIKNLHVYAPIEKYNEIDTSGLIENIRREYPQVNIEIAPKQSGASVPKNQSYDLTVIPVLGFDRRGFRLGYGGGYYDKFLAGNDCRQIIGLAYSFSEVPQIPDESFDKKMDLIITEKELIKAT